MIFEIIVVSVISVIFVKMIYICLTNDNVNENNTQRQQQSINPMLFTMSMGGM